MGGTVEAEVRFQKGAGARRQRRMFMAKQMLSALPQRDVSTSNTRELMLGE